MWCENWSKTSSRSLQLSFAECLFSQPHFFLEQNWLWVMHSSVWTFSWFVTDTDSAEWRWLRSWSWPSGEVELMSYTVHLNTKYPMLELRYEIKYVLLVFFWSLHYSVYTALFPSSYLCIISQHHHFLHIKAWETPRNIWISFLFGSGICPYVLPLSHHVHKNRQTGSGESHCFIILVWDFFFFFNI